MIIGLEVDRDEEREEWRLKLRFTTTDLPDLHQVDYKRFKDLMTLFSYVITFTGEDK